MKYDANLTKEQMNWMMWQRTQPVTTYLLFKWELSLSHRSYWQWMPSGVVRHVDLCIFVELRNISEDLNIQTSFVC
jgi:hypothetical protein